MLTGQVLTGPSAATYKALRIRAEAGVRSFAVKVWNAYTLKGSFDR
jgi:hypothetical protein